jgi:hypothetical protein
MSEEIIRDLINRLDAKMRKQMEDYIDLCNRADCDMEEATNHMLGLSIRIAVVGLISCGMNKKDVLTSVAIAYDIARPNVENAQKKIKARR